MDLIAASSFAWWEDRILGLCDPLQAALAPVRKRLLDGDPDGARSQLTALLRAHLAEQARHLGRPSLTNAEPGSPQEAAHAKDLAQGRQLVLLKGQRRILPDPVDWRLGLTDAAQWNAHLGYFYWASALVRHRDEAGMHARTWCGLVRDFLVNMPYGTPAIGWFPSRPYAEMGRRSCDNGEGDWNGPAHWMSLSAAFRADAWMEGLVRLAHDPALDDGLLWGIVRSLYRQHALCLVNNPRGNTPNQYIHTSVALIKLGLLVPWMNEAPGLLQIGLARLRDAISRQVLPDGGDLEQSPNYNWGLIDQARELLESLRALPAAETSYLRSAAARRARALLQQCDPSLRQHDIAKAHAGDQRQRLLAAAREFAVPDVAWVASRGSEGAEPAWRSAWMPWSGLAVLRSGWDDAATQLLLKASPRGTGHMHEDALQVLLSHGGRRLLVDSGNYSYDGHDDLHRRMNAYGASSRAHATVLVDGRSQDRAGLTRKMNPEPCFWRDVHAADVPRQPGSQRDGGRFAHVEGIYADGHGGGQAPVVHRRRVLWIRDYGFLVADLLDPADAVGHAYSQLWMLAPEFMGGWSVSGARLDAEAPGGPGLCIHALVPEGSALVVAEGQEEPCAGWYAPEYGRRVPKPDLAVSWSGTGRQLVAAWLAPTGPDLPALVHAASRRADGRLIVELAFADAAVLHAEFRADACSARLSRGEGQAESCAVNGPDGDVLLDANGPRPFPTMAEIGA